MCQEEKTANARQKSPASSLLVRAREVVSIEIAGLEQIREQLDEAFVELVYACLRVLDAGGKIVICGVGKSGHIGHKISATLASTGSRSVFMHPVEAMHGDLGMLSPSDLLLALSYSGETDELLAVLPSAKRLGLPIVSITGNADSSLAEWCDLVVPMCISREACPFNLAPTATTTALLALGDALAMVLLECRQFGPTDYAKLHPAGAIGRRITLRVRDIMRTGDRFVRVHCDTLVRDALLAMTKARCGAVAVVDDAQHPRGVFTDGDFRRHITEGAEVLQAPIGTVMTANPICIADTAMAVELVNLLERRKIDDVLVVDDANRAVGLVDIQDLPRFKIM